MKSAIVSGSTGFLGRNTVAALLAQGYRVYALSRKGKEAFSFLKDTANLIVVPSSFDDIETLPEKIPHADLFIHAAWGGVNRAELDDPTIQEANVSASIRYLSVLDTLGVRYFIDYGSRAEYGNRTGSLSEELPCQPQNAYGRSKLAFYEKARAFCQEHGISYVHLRFFSVFGKGDHPWSLMSSLGAKLPKGEPVELGPCMQRWNMLSIQDAMAYVVAIIESMESEALPNGIAINVASKDTRKLREYIESANALCGNKSELRFGEYVPMKGSAEDVIPDTTRLQSLVPIEEQGFEAGFLAMIQEEE